LFLSNEDPTKRFKKDISMTICRHSGSLSINSLGYILYLSIIIGEMLSGFTTFTTIYYKITPEKPKAPRMIPVTNPLSLM
jgi:hypothetical protein